MVDPRFMATIKGSLPEFLKEEQEAAARAVRGGVGDITYGVRDIVRGQVRRAGFRNRKIEFSVQGRVYPRSSKGSLRSAGEVYSKAPEIMESFEYGSTIKSSEGLYLAIPSPEAPRTIGKKRITPALWEERTGERLIFVFRPGHRSSLLVAPNQRASYSRKTGELRGFKPASDRAKKSGKGLTSVVMFYLVPRAKMPKLINFFKAVEQGYRELPDAILLHWRSRNGR